MAQPNAKKSYEFENAGEEIGRLGRQARLGVEREVALLTALGVSGSARVLDAGCGPGLISELMAKLVPQGSVVGFDQNSEFVSEARRRCVGFGNLRFEVGDLEKVGEADGSFDVVYSRLVFSHLRNPLKVLGEFRRVLKPGGVVCVADIDDGSILVWPEVENLVSLVSKAAASQARSGGDRFVGRKLSLLLQEAGFRDVGFRSESFHAVDESSVSLVEILLSSRLSHLDSADAKKLEHLIKQISSKVAAREQAFSYSVFVASGRK